MKRLMVGREGMCVKMEEMKWRKSNSSIINNRNGEKARVGTLEIPTRSISMETPALLLSTRKGLPHFVPPDHLPSLPTPDSSLLHFSPLHFIQGLSPKTLSNIGGLCQLLALPRNAFIAFPRDSLLSIPDAHSSSKLGASFDTPSGRCLLSTNEYMELISCTRPDIWCALADEVPASASSKRNATSVNRTLTWLDCCISLIPVGGAVFGSVVGGLDVEERKRCAKEVAKRNVSGYWLGGFGLGESMDDRSLLLNAVTDFLPEEKPRLICGLELPEEVLEGVAAGVDLFDSKYIYHLTIGGFALTFPLDKISTNASDFPSSAMGVDQTKINLKATIFRKDVSPIVDGCSCYTCQTHTKAYINHLLNVHEMLAQTLLEIHNTHHYLGFFRLIREAIKEGRFEEFRHMFCKRRRHGYVSESVPQPVLAAGTYCASHGC